MKCSACGNHYQCAEWCGASTTPTTLEQRMRKLATAAVGSPDFTPAVLDAIRAAVRLGMLEAALYLKQQAEYYARVKNDDVSWQTLHDEADAIRARAAELEK